MRLARPVPRATPPLHFKVYGSDTTALACAARKARTCGARPHKGSRPFHDEASKIHGDPCLGCRP
ncbi:hypothetical protein [Streptomyces sp. NPDC060366]|uniref:hypothetical protein n=1 Tax=Streptomyces sp. NPDC060366 TaxID=3347105 RepID=UPI003667D992